MNNMTTDLTKYDRLSEMEHLLKRPDTTMGSIKPMEQEMWLYNKENNSMEIREITMNPGILKIFDEAIVNCRDHYIRQMEKKGKENIKQVTLIEVEIKENGEISIMNDGNGIDIEKHPKEKDIWIPESVFFQLRSGTNFNDDEEKITGGKNGYGAKLVYVWSKYGIIETVDHVRKLKYIQRVKDNMSKIETPKITKYGKNPYTKLTFMPDYERFGIELTKDMIEVLRKRVIDLCAVIDKSVKVRIKIGENEWETLMCKTFQQYCELYVKENIIYEKPSERWEYGVGKSKMDKFSQISFVNGINTFKGGKHVDAWINQFNTKMIKYIESKKKIKVSGTIIKDQIILILRSDIINPSFNSQTKDCLNTPQKEFGSTFEISDKFIEKCATKLGIMERCCEMIEIKEKKIISKSDGNKSTNVRGIKKYEPANWSGTKRSHECELILCEGDSAKSAVSSGLSEQDRNKYGVYALKGKLENSRGKSDLNIYLNDEIKDIIKILGLEYKKKYLTMEDVKKYLNYGKVMIITDQDLDGSHIKGLCINLFHYNWYELTKIPGFLCFMNTPLLKATLGKRTYSFYNENEYKIWKNTTNNSDKYHIKYYKGLGTSVASEFKEYFREKKIVEFRHIGKSSDEIIEMAFDKTKINERKKWLENYERDLVLDTSLKMVSYDDFINKELIHFSKYDCERSIPNMMDGLKISNRKILYSAFLKNLTNEIKVAQFSGYVAEKTAYHHGEDSISKAIIGMAQNYVGSNNINLLYPSGQFGTRNQNGKDHASPRYIFTKLCVITRKIFREEDDAILEYLYDDGEKIEPHYYVPIIPMILVNGSSGIGTGFSTKIPCYNVVDIINYLINKLDDKENKDVIFKPYYNNFKGTVEEIGEKKYELKIPIEINKNRVVITELPLSMPIDKFKEHLEGLMDDKNSVLKSFKNGCSDEEGIKFTLEFKEIPEDIYKYLKMNETISTNNLHMFNHLDKLTKYENIKDIIDDYYEVRFEYYTKRKEYLIQYLEKVCRTMRNRANFIEKTINGQIDLREKNDDEIKVMLEKQKFDKEDESFDYLLNMKMRSVSKENNKKIRQDYKNKENELEMIKKMSEKEMWKKELNELLSLISS
uniref:DNA topoisomerase (ATP-hydrolyzing) n=1 Tax=viral metagenome TaxID=1070528 RepID=A0A6C0H5P6_9ZZZZ